MGFNCKIFRQKYFILFFNSCFFSTKTHMFLFVKKQTVYSQQRSSTSFKSFSPPISKSHLNIKDLPPVNDWKLTNVGEKFGPSWSFHWFYVEFEVCLLF